MWILSILAGKMDLEGKYPALDAWKERLFAPTARKKAIAGRAEAMAVEVTTWLSAGQVREN